MAPAGPPAGSSFCPNQALVPPLSLPGASHSAAAHFSLPPRLNRSNSSAPAANPVRTPPALASCLRSMSQLQIFRQRNMILLHHPPADMSLFTFLICAGWGRVGGVVGGALERSRFHVLILRFPSNSPKTCRLSRVYFWPEHRPRGFSS